MPGQAVVTIRDSQWQVSIADADWELIQGLGGIPEIPAGTGMFFDTGAMDIIEVTTAPMLFPIDIAFLSEELIVTEVYQNVAPGYVVTSTSPARYFLEVNAGELEGISSGDRASVEIVSLAVDEIPVVQQDPVTTMMQYMTFMIMMTFMTMMARDVVKAAVEPPKPPREVAPGYRRIGERRGLWERMPQTEPGLSTKWYKRGLEAGKAEDWMNLEEAMEDAIRDYPKVAQNAHSLVEVAKELWEETDHFYIKYGSDMLDDAADALKSRREMADYGLDVGTLYLELESEFWDGYIQGRKAKGIDIYDKAKNLLSQAQYGERRRNGYDQGFMPQTKRMDAFTLPFAGATRDKVWWMATIGGRIVEVQVTGIRRLTERELEGALADSVAVVKKSNIGSEGLRFGMAREGKMEWIDLKDGNIVDVTVLGVRWITDKRLEDALSQSKASISGPSPEYLPKTGGVRDMPKLPDEAKDNEKFVSYIRDVVELGQPLTEEEVKHLWTAWKIMVQKGYHPQTKMTVYCPICGKEVSVPGYDSMTRTEALREHIQAEHPQQARRSPKYQAQTAKLTREDVTVDAWQERDRLGIWVTNKRTGDTVAEWWDEDARQMFEDGFFEPGVPQRSGEALGRTFVNSVLDYLEDMGVLAQPAEGPVAPERPGNFHLRQDRMGNIILEYSEERGKDVLLQFEAEKAVIYDILTEHEERELNAGWEVFVAAKDPRASVLEELWQYAEPKNMPQTQRKQPAVTPREGKERQRRDSGIDYYADSPEFLTQTVDLTGYRDKISQTFQEAIARAKRGKQQ